MSLPQSRITAQGQISVPAAVRRKLGLAPGSILEWEIQGENTILRRVGQYSSEDLHRHLFPEGPPGSMRVDQLKAGIRKHIKSKHARR